VAGKSRTWWAVLQAHFRASPVKSALLGVLMLLLLLLVLRPLFRSPRAAEAAAVSVLPRGPQAERAETSAAPAPADLPLLPDLPAALVRDPFAVEVSRFQPVAGNEPETDGNDTTDPGPPVQDTGDPLADAIAKMRLQSTVTGTSPMATVDGTLLRVGDRYRGFSVVRIGARFVVLDAAGRQFVLTMP